MIPDLKLIADLELTEDFLVPAADLVIGALEDGTCPGKIAVLLQCLAVAAARYDPDAEDDLAALLAQAMREAAIDLMSGAQRSGERPS
jgi:hypothetical protein